MEERSKRHRSGRWLASISEWGLTGMLAVIMAYGFHALGFPWVLLASALWGGGIGWVLGDAMAKRRHEAWMRQWDAANARSDARWERMRGRHEH